MTTKELLEIETAMRNGSKLTDAQVAKVAELRRDHNAGNRWVSVSKIALRDGEELWDFVGALATAVHTDRVILANGSLDAMLQGIYDDHVIVQDWNTGKLFKATFSRAADGSFSFGEPEEVMLIFVPVDAGDEDDEVERAVAKRAPTVVERVNIGAASGKWAGVLPRRF